MLYTSLFGESSTLLSSERSHWNSAVGSEIDEENWDRIHLYIHKGSLNVSIQENGYKLKTRWYKTPDLLHKFSPSVSDQCWRCGKERGTFLHIWWECPTLQPFWHKVHDVTKMVSSLPLEFCPAQYLLHFSKISKGGYFKSVAMHMINAARMCIPVHWRSTSPPSMAEWASRINRVAEMEELIYTASDNISKFTAIWNTWTTFKNSQSYKDLLNNAD